MVGIPSVAALLVPTEPNPIFFGAAAAAFFPPTCPKPSRATPIPSLSISPEVRSRVIAVLEVEFSGVGAAIFVFSDTLAV